MLPALSPGTLRILCGRSSVTGRLVTIGLTKLSSTESFDKYLQGEKWNGIIVQDGLEAWNWIFIFRNFTLLSSTRGNSTFTPSRHGEEGAH